MRVELQACGYEIAYGRPTAAAALMCICTAHCPHRALWHACSGAGNPAVKLCGAGEHQQSLRLGGCAAAGGAQAASADWGERFCLDLPSLSMLCHAPCATAHTPCISQQHCIAAPTAPQALSAMPALAPQIGVLLPHFKKRVALVALFSCRNAVAAAAWLHIDMHPHLVGHLSVRPMSA